MIVDFARPKHAETLWQRLEIERYWEHHNHCMQQRFLGSLRISKQVSEQLLDITAQNLGRVKPLTFKNLCKRFDTWDPQRYWIRIITLALSEYAYYDEGDAGFWQGICDRLNIQNTNGVQNALRTLLDQGFKLWGVVTTQKGNRYVSTLWLQSGIPQQNLNHFSQLLEEISQQYDWWDIAHTSPEDLSSLLYEFCQQHHPQWGKLLTFLESSVDNEGKAEPIAGKLLQGLAIVAQVLERQGLEPTVLQNVHQREQLLQQFFLPNTFFLRNWDNLIQILTPQKQNLNSRQKIISRRQKSLSLVLDIADSMEIQLVLPVQTLWRPQWENLRETYCQIPQQGWETTLPKSGALNIPELNLPIESISDEWIWSLRSHNGSCLVQWRCQGVLPEEPVLFFDPWTGDRLIPPDGLIGKTDIICFYDQMVELQLLDGVQLIDNFVPCTISGWRGQQLQLVGEQGQLTICFPHCTKVIPWYSRQANAPQLRGLKLKCKDPTYVEVPSVWHPPLQSPKTICIQVEDLDRRQILTASDAQVSLPASTNWEEIPLSKWIAGSGKYVVTLWSTSEAQRWSEKFEVVCNFELTQPTPISPIQIGDRTRQSISVPIQVDSTSEFWLAELTLQKLWPLEEVRFCLTNGQQERGFVKQANTCGFLPFNLAVLRDVLPESDCYSLSCQRQGEEPLKLIETSTRKAISWTWTRQEIYLSGLQMGQSYTLSIWNILQPEHSAERFSFQTTEDCASFVLAGCLSDTFGIFYLELERSTCAPLSLGWWSSIDSNKNLILPDYVNGEYCCNILDNEPLKDFCKLFSRINANIDSQKLNRAISCLRNSRAYLPEGLNLDLLGNKLQKIIFEDSPNPSPLLMSSKPQRRVYLLNIDNNRIRNSFIKKITEQLQKSGWEQKIKLLQVYPHLPDLLSVEIESEEYLYILNKMLTNFELEFNFKIKLIPWHEKRYGQDN